MKDTMFLPPASLRRASRRPRAARRYGWPCEGAGHEDAARRRPRSDRAADGRRRRARRAVQHRGRSARSSAGCCSAAARYQRHAHPVAAGGREDDHARHAGAERNVRGLGWDIDSSFSSNRGELLPVGSFGHTGFTGTSIWIDPATGLFVVFLSNRVHPGRQGRRHAAARARRDRRGVGGRRQLPRERRRRRGPAATSDRPGRCRRAPAASPVLSGIDVLRADGFAPLRGKRVGLVTNHTGRARDGATTIDLLLRREGREARRAVQPRARHPRHPRREGRRRANDEKTGLPIHSLYGETRRPTAAMLDGIDTIVHRSPGHRRPLLHLHDDDGLRDGGGGEARASRWSCSTGRIPIDGFQIEGPTLDEGAARVHRLLADADPPRHDASASWRRLFNAENKIGAELTVVQLQELAARRLVRRDRAALDQPVAEHAQPDPGDALSGHRRDRGDRTSRSAAAPTRRSSRSARRGSTAWRSPRR